MNRLICLDPGTNESALVEWNRKTGSIGFRGKLENEEALRALKRCAPGAMLVVEMIKSYGNAMGDSTIETCVWIGRFIEAYLAANPAGVIHRLPRKTVVTALCNTARASDTNVRQAVIDLMAARTHPVALGGGKVPVIGNKAIPGPLYKFGGDLWSALAVGLAFELIESQKSKQIERMVE